MFGVAHAQKVVAPSIPPVCSANVPVFVVDVCLKRKSSAMLVEFTWLACSSTSLERLLSPRWILLWCGEFSVYPTLCLVC